MDDCYTEQVLRHVWETPGHLRRHDVERILRVYRRIQEPCWRGEEAKCPRGFFLRPNGSLWEAFGWDLVLVGGVPGRVDGEPAFVHDQITLGSKESCRREIWEYYRSIGPLGRDLLIKAGVLKP